MSEHELGNDTGPAAPLRDDGSDESDEEDERNYVPTECKCLHTYVFRLMFENFSFYK